MVTVPLPLLPVVAPDDDWVDEAEFDDCVEALLADAWLEALGEVAAALVVPDEVGMEVAPERVDEALPA